ncbi:TetR/AcrR family transcriptional regulator [Cronobacter malonaticus]|uniref:TetR/AcrR family transcriptional regulator n=1 Tax=Cronobacter malonaticus TaxID=413503 RepID=UPI0029BFBB18|nr:TetR/AcrR family transcriptional regulator [Cronobacter malonaticus]ELY2620270.1 TetR/AcrR family transcriptional regulator [Cronobacter malonaticus]ELY3621932.1 TetR/AcrR family transcriptional regulator [Cronobacter malonaticus]
MSEIRTRQRLSRDARHTQLIEMAWQIIREEGTEALTLGRLAERAGVTKPVVYDHFTSRSGLLAALYHEYEVRQNRKMDEAIARTPPALLPLAAVIADAYIECVLLQGREMPNVMAALTGTPELEKLRQDYAVEFINKCRTLFAPLRADNALRDAALWAMFGAAEGLSWAVTMGAIDAGQAKAELRDAIVGMVEGK